MPVFDWGAAYVHPDPYLFNDNHGNTYNDTDFKSVLL